jgi:hypothetical protein
MSVLVDKNTNFIWLGFTGENGTFHYEVAAVKGG